MELDLSEQFEKKFRKRRHDINLINRPFIGWDGEGWTEHPGTPCECAIAGNSGCPHHYCLFGASTGDYVQAKSLNTKDCLDLITQIGQENPDAIHIAFAFEYDVNMILKNLGERHLRILKENGSVKWRTYRIEHMPKKWFQVTRYWPDESKTVTRIQDIFTFFASSFVSALRDWSVGTDDEITSIEQGKAGRSTFSLDELDQFIKPYWRKELDLLVKLGDTLRTRLDSVGLRPGSWHGPGALGATVFNKYKTRQHMNQELTREIVEASAYAFTGGRIQPFKAGVYEGPVYYADINSAYPYAMSRLPSLANGTWEYTRNRQKILQFVGRLALVEIYFDFYRSKMDNPEYVYPVFRRFRDGRVEYPKRAWGTYHLPEAQILFNLKETQPHLFRYFNIKGAWLYHDDGSYPFAWVVEMYRQRAAWKAEGNPAQLALKLVLNSLYGKLAQRVGGTDGPPSWHQLEWAGLITATTRRMLYDAAMSCGDGIISMNTDGIFSLTEPTVLTNGAGDELGQWETGTYDGIISLQSGIYWLKKGKTWMQPKTRGIPRSSLDVNSAMNALISQENLQAQHTTFTGYRAVLLPSRMRNGWRTWETKSKEFRFGDGSKMFHMQNSPLCKACSGTPRLGWHEALHDLIPQLDRSLGDYLKAKKKGFDNDIWDFYRSSIHVLPWLNMDETQLKTFIQEETENEIYE